MTERDPDARPPGRNDPCWCGSGTKYKKCHLDEDGDARRTRVESAAVTSRNEANAPPPGGKSALARRGFDRGGASATNKRPHKKTRK